MAICQIRIQSQYGSLCRIEPLDNYPWHDSKEEYAYQHAENMHTHTHTSIEYIHVCMHIPKHVVGKSVHKFIYVHVYMCTQMWCIQYKVNSISHCYRAFHLEILKCFKKAGKCHCFHFTDKERKPKEIKWSACPYTKVNVCMYICCTC